jgi:hypothetical protein
MTDVTLVSDTTLMPPARPGAIRAHRDISRRSGFFSNIGRSTWPFSMVVI